MIDADQQSKHSEGQPGLFQAALSGLCPRCGKPTLFEAPASVAITCEACGLDFTKLERGARLAGLVTILIAALLIGAAIGVDIAINPPFWLQALFWGPFTIAATIGTLRFYKTALLYRQYDIQIEQKAQGE
ncbi:DUF983 domain-containing protein [Erythrobacter sp. MTPC3]